MDWPDNLLAIDPNSIGETDITKEIEDKVLKDFTPIKVIGYGSFGKVYLVKNK